MAQPNRRTSPGLIAAQFWEPDQSFAGQTITIVGGGPSHVAFDPELLRGHPFIAVNSACRRVRPVAAAQDILFFLDLEWAAKRQALIEDWPGARVTTSRMAKIQFGDAVRRINVNDLARRLGATPDCLVASSGHAAACLAAAMGASRIVLIGFECAAPKGRTHGHNDYTHRDTGIYAKRFLPGWRAIAPIFERLGVDVLNATPRSLIQEFPLVDLREAINELAETRSAVHCDGS